MFNTKKLLVAIVAALLITLAIGCSSNQTAVQDTSGQTGQAAVESAPSQAPTSYQDIDAAQAKQLIDSDKTLQIIDVREEYEHNEGYIPGTKLIPIGEFISRMGEIDKSRPVLIYCASGSRSAQAAQVLVQSGYATVYNLAPGTQSWPYPLEK